MERVLYAVCDPLSQSHSCSLSIEHSLSLSLLSRHLPLSALFSFFFFFFSLSVFQNSGRVMLFGRHIYNVLYSFRNFECKHTHTPTPHTHTHTHLCTDTGSLLSVSLSLSLSLSLLSTYYLSFFVSVVSPLSLSLSY